MPGVCLSLVRGVSFFGRGGVCFWSREGVSTFRPGEGGTSQHAMGQTRPPVNRMTDTCKNITLVTTSLRPVIIDAYSAIDEANSRTVLGLFL